MNETTVTTPNELEIRVTAMRNSESEEAPGHVVKVAVLVTADVRPKDLSRTLDAAFEDVGEVLHFTVEGYGVEKIEDATEESLMAGLMSDLDDQSPL